MPNDRHRPSQRAPLDAHKEFHRGLLQVHAELRAAVAAIGAAVSGDTLNMAATRALIAHFCQELLNHHKAEDAFLFPAFRRIGRLAASDLAFLAERDDEHIEIHRLCLELRDTGARGGESGFRDAVAVLIGELAQRSGPHFEAEERVLTPAHLQTIITGAELAMVQRDMGQNWNSR